MDARIKKINRLLTRYSLGSFDTQLQLSEKYDEIDAIIAGINMLGEELRDTTISLDYFNNIFHSVSDMALVLNNKGYILDANATALTELSYSYESLVGKHIDELKSKKQNLIFSHLRPLLKKGENKVSFQSVLSSNRAKIIPVSVTGTLLKKVDKKNSHILLMMKDISFQLKTENLVIRTIIDTQEKERLRLAKDLHDSLGQQLAAIKFFLGASVSMASSKEQISLLEKSNEAMIRILSDMRNICFNLAPRTLEEFGLVRAVEELCAEMNIERKISFHIRKSPGFPSLPKDLEIDLFRIVQEFISNAVKYSHCNKVSVFFTGDKSRIAILLKDNGCGFDLRKTRSAGMGLKNVRSRAKSHNLHLEISSILGKGTSYKLEKLFNEK